MVFLKAISGAIVAFLTVIAAADNITQNIWLKATLAAVVGFNAVYWTPNKGQGNDASISSGSDN